MNPYRLLPALLGAALSLGTANPASAGEPVALNKLSHVHGIAVNPRDTRELYLATHHGLYLASPDGSAVPVSQERNDLMGFSPHPAVASTLYASGHPPGGGNLGLIVSTDGGRTWKRLSPGAHGPVDFHALSVSRVDPEVMYGTHGGLQLSRDGGRSWEVVGPLPGRVIDLAASPTEASTVYAATAEGLLISRDGGRAWQTAYPARDPASLVESGPHGQLYAFLLGVGLLESKDGNWTRLSNAFGGRYLLHLAADPKDSAKLYAVTQDSEILASEDGGRHWHAFGAR